MGDMQVSVANAEDKVFNGLLEDKPIKAAASSNPSLQVSVSFGRFENDSLSWEKFSAFSPNKYLEEVGKCATPGSVAQKKAYFEAHYKKIAERKAEIMEQETQMERYPSFKSNATSQGTTNDDNGRITAESVVKEGSNEQFTCEEDKHITDITTKVNESNVHELNEERIVVKECQSLVDKVKEEVGESVEKPEVELKEIAAMEEKPEVLIHVEVKPNIEEAKEVRDEVKVEISSSKTPIKEIKKVKHHNLIKKKDGNVLMNRTRSSPTPNQVTKKPVTNKIAKSKKTPPSREVNVMKPAKKPAVPISKSPGVSTPRDYKKPASQITSLSTSLRKENVSALLRNKQTTPKSLHISLSLGPSASDPSALASTRKSLIMERMGDKDIVKRAFKSFQKSFDSKQQNPATGTSPLTRPTKVSSAEKRSSNAHSSSSRDLKTNETAPKQKELSKLSARPVEKTRLQKNTKAGVTDTKARKDHLDLKAKPVQGSLPVRTTPKSSVGKVL